ncbi:MAG: cold shock domain-containing protein [Lachnospiraceae bacterium]|nr:cold shock domain-containing protein [Lachnospiraceae bacterium]
MIGKIMSFEPLKGCGIITTLTGEELPVQARNVNMNGAVVLHKNDVVEYELGTDDNGNPQAVNVSVIQKAEYAVKLSRLTFKDFGVDIKNNILDVPKCENHDEYCVFRFENEEELRDSICRHVCTSGKYPCGVAVLRKNNQVLVGYSDKDKPSEFCRFQNYGIKDAPKDQQYLSVGELLTKTYELENYGIMLELEDNFYHAIME